MHPPPLVSFDFSPALKKYPSMIFFYYFTVTSTVINLTIFPPYLLNPLNFSIQMFQHLICHFILINILSQSVYLYNFCCVCSANKLLHPYNKNNIKPYIFLAFYFRHFIALYHIKLNITVVTIFII